MVENAEVQIRDFLLLKDDEDSIDFLRVKKFIDKVIRENVLGTRLELAKRVFGGTTVQRLERAVLSASEPKAYPLLRTLITDIRSANFSTLPDSLLERNPQLAITMENLEYLRVYDFLEGISIVPNRVEDYVALLLGKYERSNMAELARDPFGYEYDRTGNLSDMILKAKGQKRTQNGKPSLQSLRNVLEEHRRITSKTPVQ